MDSKLFKGSMVPDNTPFGVLIGIKMLKRKNEFMLNSQQTSFPYGLLCWGDVVFGNIFNRGERRFLK